MGYRPDHCAGAALEKVVISAILKILSVEDAVMQENRAQNISKVSLGTFNYKTILSIDTCFWKVSKVRRK